MMISCQNKNRRKPHCNCASNRQSTIAETSEAGDSIQPLLTVYRQKTLDLAHESMLLDRELLNASLRHCHELVIGEAGSALVRPRLFFYCFGLVQLVVFFCFGSSIIRDPLVQSVISTPWIWLSSSLLRRPRHLCPCRLDRRRLIIVRIACRRRAFFATGGLLQLCS